MFRDFSSKKNQVQFIIVSFPSWFSPKGNGEKTSVTKTPKFWGLGLVAVDLPALGFDTLPLAKRSCFQGQMMLWESRSIFEWYVPGTQMTLVLVGKGLLLEGSNPKIEDKQVPGLVHQRWMSKSEMKKAISGVRKAQKKKSILYFDWRKAVPFLRVLEVKKCQLVSSEKSWRWIWMPPPLLKLPGQPENATFLSGASVPMIGLVISRHPAMHTNCNFFATPHESRNQRFPRTRAQRCEARVFISTKGPRKVYRWGRKKLGYV